MKTNKRTKANDHSKVLFNATKTSHHLFTSFLFANRQLFVILLDAVFFPAGYRVVLSKFPSFLKFATIFLLLFRAKIFIAK